MESSSINSQSYDGRRWRLADFSEIAAVPCPCGQAKRAFHGVPEFPGTIHITEIHEDARKHYHQRLTETYVFLECGEEAQMELENEIIHVRPLMATVIPTGVRHRAIGRMKVLIVVLPEFDPTDEHFD